MRIILDLLKMSRIRADDVGNSRTGGEAGAGPSSSTPPESTQLSSSPLLRVSDVDHHIHSVDSLVIISQFYNLYFDLCSEIFLIIIAIFFKYRIFRH
jgi:hypothetical protein